MIGVFFNIVILPPTLIRKWFSGATAMRPIIARDVTTRQVFLDFTWLLTCSYTNNFFERNNNPFAQTFVKNLDVIFTITYSYTTNGAFIAIRGIRPFA